MSDPIGYYEIVSYMSYIYNSTAIQIDTAKLLNCQIAKLLDWLKS